eukprot:CAMPEP_0168350158 /NCGR_PEP_ID=MMETSP0213-20121227/20927_1 /TAXON_ID=151035 /ORGANISM="Euplotes harpa, Strain FSP1.4" /LENGTH=68 /DNA_ID=CAMNT_0008360401 /DNA_START=609 /DNA_END=815 /DNA_ORIENTATION=-
MAKELNKLPIAIGMLGSEEIKENLKELLRRWEFSYSYRPRDSYSLQFTTRIDFNELLRLNLLEALEAS